MKQKIPEQIQNLLSVALKKGRLAHALLFVGPSEEVKELTALHLAAALLCENKMVDGNANKLGCLSCLDCQLALESKHLNLHLILSESEADFRSNETSKAAAKSSIEIRIDAIRELNREQRKQSYNKKPQIWLVTKADLLTNQASNALLKTLEEPEANHYIFLIAPSRNTVLTTISSRCQSFNFPGSAEYVCEKDSVELFKKIKTLSLSSRVELVEDLAKDKNAIQDKLSGLQIVLMDNIRRDLDSPNKAKTIEFKMKIVNALELAQNDINMHANAQLVLEDLFLNVWH